MYLASKLNSLILTRVSYPYFPKPEYPDFEAYSETRKGLTQVPKFPEKS